MANNVSADRNGGMASFVYNGVRYNKKIEPQDGARVAELKDKYLQRYVDNAKKQGKNTIPAAVARAAETKAIAQERQERLKRAVDGVQSKNSDKKLNDDGSPNPTVSNGGVASGDPGISQRRTQPANELKGAAKADPTATRDNPYVTTDDQANDKVAALAEDLNKRMKNGDSDKLGSGWVDRKFATPGSDKDFLEKTVELAFDTAGTSPQEDQIVNFFSRHDRFERTMAPVNAEFAGYTFFTRPRLNLSINNLVADDKFASMRTTDTAEFAFAIKCFLDTQFCKDEAIASTCPLIDTSNPFNTLLCNALQSLTGFNDPILETETSNGGFYQEDQTVVIGGDRLTKTYELNAQFRDIPGGPVAAMFDYWCQYMANLQDGTFVQYGDAIDANRLDYTISIYRFLTDRTRRYITKWAKATGCFPLSAPVGVPFNKNQGEHFVTAAKEFSVMFKVNRLEYNKPIIISEFNTLVRRYAGWGESSPKNMPQRQAYLQRPYNNFSGLPYIRISESRGYEMVFLKSDSQNVNTQGGGSLPNLKQI